VSDDRARRSAVLTAAAKAKSQAKTSAAEQAIRTLVKRGEPVTFQAVGREADVSHAFLYAHQDLRRRIEHLRAQARPVPPPHQRTETPDTVVLALTAQIDQLKKQHRQQVAELRAALEQAHGENLNLRRELARRGHHDHAVAIETTP
jgi:vacuolar-type H+-ATPase subunit I/STV1